MDKNTLEYMAKKVKEGEILSSRIKFLKSFKEKLTKEGSYLMIEVLEGGFSKALHEGANKVYVCEKYKDFVLIGVDAELAELEKEFEKL